jgi:hypothetical protein
MTHKKLAFGKQKPNQKCPKRSLYKMFDTNQYEKEKGQRCTFPVHRWKVHFDRGSPQE